MRTHIASELCLIHIVTPLTSGCVCWCRRVSRCWCVCVLAGRSVCEVRLNRRLAMRGGNRGGTGRISHTYAHKAVTKGTTLSEQHARCRCGLRLSHHPVLCFDPVACHGARIMLGNVCVTVYACVFLQRHTLNTRHPVGNSESTYLSK